jgi:copper chaperone
MHQLHIPGMKCGGCLGAIMRAVQGIDPQATVEADLETRLVRITSQKDTGSLLSALKAAGYLAQPKDGP